MNEKNEYASVWDAIEDTPEAAENMKRRSELMQAIEAYIKREKLDQVTAAEHFGVTQPRISNLVNGRIHLFSLETLMDMAPKAGLRVEMRIVAARSA